MIFCIITHVNHHKEQGTYFAYAPYVREMNIWLKYVDRAIIVAPSEKKSKTGIDIAYKHNDIIFERVNNFDITTIRSLFKTLISLPRILFTVYKAMKQADHIHLRCPGNMGLLGCLVQILFPKTKKTVKYAGNWDPTAIQPWSYRLQKWFLNNTFLTRNMEVLVYGEWEGSSKNIKPFFTASYSERDRDQFRKPDISSGVQLVFVGTLTPNKAPLVSLEVLKKLMDKGARASLTLCGDGVERERIEKEIVESHLKDNVKLLGNVNADTVKEALQNAHFLVFISRSEGWPKAVAEAMWWGCVPITTAVSCVPQMLDYGKRGFLVDNNPETIAEIIKEIAQQPDTFTSISRAGTAWARTYTTERFEEEIRKLL